MFQIQDNDIPYFKILPLNMFMSPHKVVFVFVPYIAYPYLNKPHKS